MFFSVVIPTYNRKPILEKCIKALENQVIHDSVICGYEIVIVDDGSTDETIPWLKQQNFPHVRYFQQRHQGPATARNFGVKNAHGDFIIFIDSDLVVTETFIQAHANCLKKKRDVPSARSPVGRHRGFTYGRVINTCNFNDPTSEPYKLTDFSAAYFATGNVAIHREWLEQAGLFDPQFQLYGWEDLELGMRLKQLGLKLIKCPNAVGYHWHPPFNLEQIPQLIEQEKQRGKMGILFYEKHPTWEVKMMIQMTLLHRILWGILSLGGLLNEKSMRPLLKWLIHRGNHQLALEISRIFLNWYNVQSVYDAYRQRKTNGSITL